MSNITHVRHKLSLRHQKVVDSFMKTGNKALALREAGYSKTYIKSQGHEIFNRRDVSEEIVRRRDKLAEQSMVDADYVIRKFKEIVEADLGDLLDIREDGSASIDFTKARPEHLAALSEFTVDEIKKGRGEDAVPVSRIRVKLHDKLRALEALGKHLGLFTDKIQINGELDLINRIEASRKQFIDSEDSEDATE